MNEAHDPEAAEPVLPSSPEVLALAHEHVLEIERSAEDQILRIRTPDGRAGLAITITSAGIRLDVTGGDLTLHTQGALSIDAEELSLHGRKSVAISTTGDATLRAEGDLHTEGRIQNIRARLGNVNVQANDDVKLLGERVRLNT